MVKFKIRLQLKNSCHIVKVRLELKRRTLKLGYNLKVAAFVKNSALVTTL